jgi:hypothetical protein
MSVFVRVRRQTMTRGRNIEEPKAALQTYTVVIISTV